MALTTQWSLRRRTLVLALAPAVLMLIILMGYLVSARLLDAKHEQAQSGSLMASQLAASADYAVISGNLDSLNGQIQALLQQPGVVSVRIFDADHRLLLRRQRQDAGSPREWLLFPAEIRQEPLALDRNDWLVGNDESSAPQLLGQVEVAISLAHSLKRERNIIMTSFFLGVGVLGLVAALGIWMARDLERPLRAIIGLVGALKGRNFQARVSIRQDGELGALAYHLNLLAAMLEENRTLQLGYTDELIVARTRADKASQAKSEFLAMMSHELRTPLNGILGGLQLLTATHLTRDQQDYADLAGQATNDLRRLVDDVLDFSRLDEGRLSLQLRSFRPRELLQKLVNGYGSEAANKKLDLELVLEGSTELWLKGDEVRIRQVLSKLLDNAFKFTEKGRVGIRARISPYNNEQAHFLCEVYDSGIGISQAALPHVFEPFMQVDRSHSRRYGGAGLGLTIASRLTRLMQGDLRAESEPLVGSCFCLELVLPICEQEPVHDTPAIAVPRKSAFSAHVLVVDDNPANRKVAEAMLRATGCSVVAANNGREALECLASGGIDLVLMDCQMPVMDGYEATQRWRSQERDKRLPIIALTANASPDNETACLEAGMDAVLSKPFRRQQLEMLLTAWL